MHFCTSGEGITTAFNLLEVVSRRFVSGTGFAGGEVLWQDGFWERGHVAVNGVLYPIAEEFHESLAFDVVKRQEDAVKSAAKPAGKLGKDKEYYAVPRQLAQDVNFFLNELQSPEKGKAIGSPKTKAS